jgi:hypothetical protein
MSDSFTVEITMPGDTVTALLRNGYKLYAFKGVDGPTGGVPVVWFSTNVFSATTDIEWSEQYSGYTASSASLAPNTQVDASFSAPMNLGQLLSVGIGGIGGVGNNGNPGAISIINQTTTPFVCGVSVQNGSTGSSNPICAFPLFGKGLDVMVPLEEVYLTFATQPVNTGTVVEQSFAEGIHIDMTGLTTPAPVTFDINHGWTGPGYTTNIPAGSNLVKELVNPGGPAAQSVRAARRLQASLLAA